MLQELIEIICEYVDVEPEAISAESNLRTDVGATSFDLMNVAVAIEEKYGVSVPNASFAKIKTVGDIIALLEK